MIAPFTCPGCGEQRLVEVDAASRGWFCQVCGQSGAVPPARVRVVVPEPLQALLCAVMARYIAPGEAWQFVLAEPFAHLPRGLQRELTQTLGALPESVVLVLERTQETPP